MENNPEPRKAFENLVADFRGMIKILVLNSPYYLSHELPAVI
jgi:hypothetical protein